MVGHVSGDCPDLTCSSCTPWLFVSVVCNHALGNFAVLPVVFSHWVLAHQHHLTLNDKTISTFFPCVLWGFFHFFLFVTSFLKAV